MHVHFQDYGRPPFHVAWHSVCHPPLSELSHYGCLAGHRKLFRPLPIYPQPIAACGKWQIDQFKLELLPGLVIYERNGVARIQFGHYSLLLSGLPSAVRRDLSRLSTAEQDEIVAT